ncbi:MAG: adenine phosphoribosyltransferase [Marinilabiliales bacterium]
MNDKLLLIKNAIRDVPDFPKKGIIFKDITTALKQPEIFKTVSEELTNQFKNKGITKVAAIEARGFILGSILAYNLDAGFVPLRKPGKLPAPSYSYTYELEYGTDSIEVHKDAFDEKDVVLLHDDLLATGGTTIAGIELIKKFNVKEIFISYFIELTFLEGRKRIGEDFELYSLINY